MNHMKLKHKSNEQVRKMIEELKEKKNTAEKKKALRENRKHKQPLISNWSNRRGKTDSFKEKKLDQALIKMTVCMNRPFSDVENHHLRNLLFIAEPNYIAPSRNRHTANFDKEALNIVEELKKEIVRDVNEAGHKTICITSDHGTSDDQFRTKKML